MPYSYIQHRIGISNLAKHKKVKYNTIIKNEKNNLFKIGKIKMILYVVLILAIFGNQRGKESLNCDIKSNYKTSGSRHYRPTPSSAYAIHLVY